MSWTKVMIDSISDNVIIFIALAVAIIFLGSSLFWGTTVSHFFDKSNGNGLKKRTYYWLDISYTIFVATISMFPLFGMLGTVISLIELGSVFQVDGANINGIKADFFLALTSTAWGIIFSLLFKFINAIVQPFLENQIDRAKKILKI